MRNQNSNQYLIRYLTILSILCVIALTYSSCKKTDELLKKDPHDHSPTSSIVESISRRGFFDMPATTHPYTKRVAEEIKRKNYINEFVTEFGKAKGVPIWEKAIISGYHKKQNGNLTSTGSTDTLVYVPIVLPGTGYSNGFVRAVINDSISLSYCLAKDYVTYPFTSSTTTVNAMQFSTFIMYLDYEVFGTQYFEITDYRLFQTGSSTINKKVKLKSATIGGGGNNLTGAELYLCWTYQNEASANGTCSCGSVCRDWFDGCTSCSYTICVEVGIGSEGLPELPPMGGGAPIFGGPSSTGGGSIPPYYPCNGNQQGSLLPEPLPPCPPTNNNVIGWYPLPTPPTPCQVVDSLMTNANFKQKLQTLRDSTVVKHEKAFTCVNPHISNPNYEEFNGSETDLSVVIDPSTAVDVIMHNHPVDTSSNGSLPIFSYADLWEMYYQYTAGKVKDRNSFTFSLATDSTSYILMINDKTLFEAFGESSSGLFGGDTTFFKAGEIVFYDQFNIVKKNSNALNEKNLLRYLLSRNAGLTLFRGNATMTQFTPIKLNSNLEVVNTDCN